MKKVKNNFSKLLKMHCKEHGIKRYELAKILDITPTHLSNLGNKYGITIHMLNKIIKLLKIKGEDDIILRDAAIYTHPKEVIVIDNRFMTKLEEQVMFNDADEISNFESVCAVLKFVGVKFKIGKM